MAKLGSVHIVGAGPGDPGLITVKGLACLRLSDVVIHDRLIEPTLLREAKPVAEIIDVGKQPGRSHQIQEWINALLITKASEGRIVCRLKGGDPFIFGRGAEEVQVLRQAGIRFEIIPGVSSINAVPASAGIPLTHRHHAHGFMVVTGCRASEASEDWSIAGSFVRGGGTLVVLMGLERVRSIVAALRDNGCLLSTPVAVISSGTQPDQETRIGTLNDIAGKISSLRPPALIIIGSVVSLNFLASQELDVSSSHQGIPAGQRKQQEPNAG
jgi:uroporphyrinogen III methyltransferase/synthase